MRSEACQDQVEETLLSLPILNHVDYYVDDISETR